MEQYVIGAKIRRIINREWPEPSADNDEPSGSEDASAAVPEGFANLPPGVLPPKPVMRYKPIFDFTCKHDARFDAIQWFFDTLYKKGIPIWCAYALSSDFVKKFEETLELQRVDWVKDEHTVLNYKFSDYITRRINEFMHGVRANETPIPEYPTALMRYEYSVAQLMGSRRTMEDRFVALPSLAMVDPEHSAGHRNDSLFCVFDGHNGAFSAMYAAGHLPEALLDEPDQPDNVMDYVTKAYFRTNDRLCQRSANDRIRSGTTAACAFIRDSKVYMFWAGDSSIMVVSSSGCEVHSTRHSPEDEAEAKRIADADGFVMNGRVNNVLNISRAMGETMAEGLVIPDPGTKVYDIKDDDYLLLILSDGVTDALTPEDIFDLVQKCAKKQPNERDLLAETLCKKADEDSPDNKTALVVYLKPVQDFFTHFASANQGA